MIKIARDGGARFMKISKAQQAFFKGVEIEDSGMYVFVPILQKIYHYVVKNGCLSLEMGV